MGTYQEVFAAHPLPWRADATGYLWDAAGEIIGSMGGARTKDAVCGAMAAFVAETINASHPPATPTDPDEARILEEARRDHEQDKATEAFLAARRYDAALNRLEIPPNGDDYNEVMRLLDGGVYQDPTENDR